MERKVLIVPYMRDGTRKTKLVIVQHAESGDWTFISGTCESREGPQRAILRELVEETLGHVTLQRIPKRSRTIRIHVGNKRIDIIFIPMMRYGRMYQGFLEFQRRCIEEDIPSNSENKNLKFVTYKQFLRHHIWDFLKSRILTSPEFNEHLQHCVGENMNDESCFDCKRKKHVHLTIQEGASQVGNW